MTLSIFSFVARAAEITTEEATTAAAEAATSLWDKIGGETMAFTDALSVSVIGFSIVFAVLGFLAIFVYGMGKVFDLNSKKKAEKKAEAPVISSSAPETPVGTPLPSNCSIGDLTLINVTEEEAAVIMAVTSSKTGIPLNRLKFNSIKLLEDEK